MSQSSGLPTTGKMPGKSDIKITFGEMRAFGATSRPSVRFPASRPGKHRGKGGQMGHQCPDQ
jgi:hypothetical protein